jgi:hypothetical protein
MTRFENRVCVCTLPEQAEHIGNLLREHNAKEKP